MAVDEVNGLYIEPGAASGAGAAIGEHPASENYENYGDGRDGDVEVDIGEAALGDKGRRSGNREGGNRLIEGRHTLRTAAPAVSPEEEIGNENNDKRPNTQARDPEGYLITGHVRALYDASSSSSCLNTAISARISPMLFAKNTSVDADEFWKNREEELGAPVIGKTLGRVVGEGETAPIWGLFYMTSKGLYFQTFASENWLSLLFTGGRGSGRTKNETVEISAEDIIRFEALPRKAGWFGLTRRPPLIELVWQSEESNGEESLLIEMDGDADAFVALFPQSASAAE